MRTKDLIRVGNQIVRRVLQEGGCWYRGEGCKTGAAHGYSHDQVDQRSLAPVVSQSFDLKVSSR